MNPAEWEEIDELLTTVFAEQGPAPFDEGPARAGPCVADPAETPLYRTLTGLAPDEWLVAFGAVVAGDRDHGPVTASWVTTAMVERWTVHLARRVAWSVPRRRVVETGLRRLVSNDVMRHERLSPWPDGESTGRWQFRDGSFGDFSPRQVLAMARTDGSVPATLVDATLALLASGRR